MPIAPPSLSTEPKPKRVGIRQIAKEADVSVATVSMVLNNNPKITAATRNRVSKVIDRLDYRPNRNAQSLSGKYTRLIAILLPTLRHAMADPYFGELISGVCDRAARLGHKVMLENAKPEFIRDKRHLELFERKFVDGVLPIGFSDQHQFLADLRRDGHPAVLVNNVTPDMGLDHVVADYTAGARQAMTCLMQLGHKRIAMIHGSLTVHTTRQLCDVYQHFCSEGGLACDESWMVDGRFTEEHGYTAMKQLLDRHGDLTAVFAGNDKMAMGAMLALAHAGKRVPDDVSVVGCDDIRYTAFVNPALTTVHLPLQEVGALACEKLIDRVRGKGGDVAEVLPTHLVLRQSTAIVRRD
jgi:LacI family transcriptional regulator